jgi:hypothetical protein
MNAKISSDMFKAYVLLTNGGMSHEVAVALLNCGTVTVEETPAPAPTPAATRAQYVRRHTIRDVCIRVVQESREALSVPEVLTRVQESREDASYGTVATTLHVLSREGIITFLGKGRGYKSNL